MLAFQKFDRGLVGLQDRYPSWARLGVYAQRAGNIDPLQAMEILGYPVEKRQLSAEGVGVVDKAYALVRADHNVVIYPYVGEVYTVLPNERLVQLAASIVEDDPTVRIDSCGTLFNGQVAHISVVLDAWMVQGDSCETVYRLLILNPFGGRSILATAYATRIGTDSSFRLQQAEGLALDTVRRYRHTKRAEEKVQAHSEQVLKLLTHLEQYKKDMDLLAGIQLSEGSALAFLLDLIPPPKKEEGEDAPTDAHRQKARNAIEEIYSRRPDLSDSAVRHTKYAMLQAVIDYADHGRPIRGDQAFRQWTGLFGDGDSMKQKAFNLLMKPHSRVNGKTETAEPQAQEYLE